MYLVATSTGPLHRNRSHPTHRTVTEGIATPDNDNSAASHMSDRSPVVTCLRAGVQLKPPDRLTL